MPKPGRPSKLTPELKERLLKAIRLGSTFETACQSTGISYRAFRLWMNKGENASSGEYFHFFQEVTRAIADAEMLLLSRIHAASQSDWRAASWVMERRWPERWSNTQRIEVQVSQRLEQQFDLFFESLLSDVVLDTEAKRRVLEIASELKEQASLAQTN